MSHLTHQVGPDIHLETEGRFHLPEVQPEHRERLFKNFSPRRCNHFLIPMIWFPFSRTHVSFSYFRVNDMSYPAGLEAFFASKDGLKIQSPVPGPSETKVIAREGSDVKETSQEPTGSPGKSGVESKASSSPQRSASPCTSCPLCSRSFPIEVKANFCWEFLWALVENPGAWRARSKMLWRWRGRHNRQLSHLWPGTAG